MTDSAHYLTRAWRWLNPQPKPVVYPPLTKAQREGEAALDHTIQTAQRRAICEQEHRDLGEDAGLCSCGTHTEEATNG